MKEIKNSLRNLQKILDLPIGLLLESGVILQVNSDFLEGPVIFAPETYQVKPTDPPVFTWRELRGIMAATKMSDRKELIKWIYEIKKHFDPNARAESINFAVPAITGRDV